MSLRAFFLWPALALLLFLVAVLLALVTVDLGVLKPQLERLVVDATGRDFSIDGQLSITIGSESVLLVEDLHFANAEWAGARDMLSLGHAELRIDTWSLLRGLLTVTQLQVDGMALSLQVDSAGRANWTLATDPAEERDGRDDDGGALNILLSQILVEDANITYLSPDREGPLNLRLERVAQIYGADDFLQLDLQGSLGDRELSASGRIGSWPALLAGKNVDFEFNAQVDTLAVSSRGHIDDLIAPRRPTLNFSAQAPDINDLMRLLQLPPDAEGDINLSGSLSSESAGPLRLAASGNLGRMTLNAEGSLSALQGPERIDLDVAAAGPDLARILRLFGVHGIGASPFALELDLERSGSLLTISKGRALFADAQLDLDARLPNFPSLDDGDMHLRIAGPDLARLREVLGLPGRSDGAYSAAFDLGVTNGGVEVARLEVESRLLRASGRATLGPVPDFLGTELALEIAIPSLAELGSIYAVDGLPERAVAIEGAATLLAEGLRTRGPLILRSGRAEASVDGLVTLVPDLVGSDLLLGLQGPDLAALIGEFAPVDAVPAQPYALSGRIRAEKTALRIEKLAGMLGSAELGAGGSLGRSGDFSGTRLDFRIAGPALEDLTAEIPDFMLKPGPFQLSGSLELSDGAMRLAPVNFVRDRADVNLELDLALPLSRREARFDLRADGADLRAVIGEPGGFAAYAAPFSVDARGALRGSLVSVRSLEAALGEATLSAAGELDLAQSRRSTTLRTAVAIPSLAALGEVDGRRFNDQGLALDAVAESDANSVKVDGLTLRIGDSDLQATVRLEKGDVPRLLLNLQSDSLRIAPLREAARFSYDPAPSFDDGRLIPDIALPLETLKKLDAEVTLSIAELERGPLRVSDVEFAATLEGGALRIGNFSLSGASGALRSRASLQPRGESAEISLDLVSRDFALSLEEVNGRVFGRLDLDASLSAVGDDLRELAASADGVIYAHARGGRMRENRIIRRLYGDMLNEIVATINPFATADSDLTFSCVIVPIEINGGYLKTRQEAFVRTDKVRIRAAAAVNLASEKLKLQLRTTPEKGLTLSASEILNPYVQVVGTLAKPRLAVDERGMLISGGAAAATGGLSILAKAAVDRLGRFADPCKAAAKAGISELESRFPALDVAPAQ